MVQKNDSHHPERVRKRERHQHPRIIFRATVLKVEVSLKHQTNLKKKIKQRIQDKLSSNKLII